MTIPIDIHDFDLIVTDEIFSGLTKKSGYIYLMGELEYESTITNNKDAYRFNWRISLTPYETQPITNQNYKVTEESKLKTNKK
jgi:hypothetical protein